jgi:hypothetical protein
VLKAEQVTARKSRESGRKALAGRRRNNHQLRRELNLKVEKLIGSSRAAIFDRDRSMTKQTTPHTQTEQNVNPEQTDLDINESRSEDEDIYAGMEGAETGTDRSPRKVPAPKEHHVTEPETAAHEGRCDHTDSERADAGHHVPVSRGGEFTAEESS